MINDLKTILERAGLLAVGFIIGYIAGIGLILQFFFGLVFISLLALLSYYALQKWLKNEPGKKAQSTQGAGMLILLILLTILIYILLLPPAVRQQLLGS